MHPKQPLYGQPTHVDLAILRAQRRARRLFAVLSVWIEWFLSYLFAFIGLFFHGLPTLDHRWDSSRGNALLIWAPTHDEVARHLALRLASRKPRPNYGSGRMAALAALSAQPPFTCIVLISDPAQLPIVVAEWAARKAELEDNYARESCKYRRHCNSPLYSPHWDSEVGSPLESLSPQQPRPETDRDEPELEPKPGNETEPHAGSLPFVLSEPPKPRSGSKPSTSAQHPTVKETRVRTMSILGTSWNDWIPHNVFGFYKDALKGVRVGAAAGPDLGSVIPIVADPSTPEGLAYVKSTVNAYCQSHKLVLRGLIMAPSVLGPRWDGKLGPGLDTLDPGAAAMQDNPVFSSLFSPAGTGSGDLNRDQYGGPAESSRSASRPQRSRANSALGPAAEILTNSPTSNWPYAAARRSASLFGDWDSASVEVGTPPLSPRTAKARERNDDELTALQQALKTDVGASAALVGALFPTLKQGKGRVLALMPAGFGVDMPDDIEFLERFGRHREVVLAHYLAPPPSLSSPPLSPPPPPVSVDSRGWPDTIRSLSKGLRSRTPQPWPISVRSTVREALQTLWTSCASRYKHSGVPIITIHTPPLVDTPLAEVPLPRSWILHSRKMAKIRRSRSYTRPRPWKYSPTWFYYMLSERGQQKLDEVRPYGDYFDDPTYAAYLRPLLREQKFHLAEYDFDDHFHAEPSGRPIWMLRKLVRFAMAAYRLMQPFDGIVLDSEPLLDDDDADDDAMPRRDGIGFDESDPRNWSRGFKVREGEMDEDKRRREAEAEAQAKAEAEEKDRLWREKRAAKLWTRRLENDALLFSALAQALGDCTPQGSYAVGFAARWDKVVAGLPGGRWVKGLVRELVDK